MADKQKTQQWREIGSKWMERIREADKREDDWLKDAEIAEEIYSMSRSNGAANPDFNILHSNIETIVPAIYNSTPVPDIRERWAKPKAVSAPQGEQPPMPGMPPQAPQPQQESDPHQDVAQLIERAIIVQIDDNVMSVEMESTAQDALLAGRGVTRIRLTADVETVTEMQVTVDEATGEMSQSEVEMDIVSNERVKYEVVSWRDYREGPATRFDLVPWVAFRHYVTSDDMKKFDGDMIAAQEIDNDEDKPDEVAIWEIWCKEKKEVIFVRDADSCVLDIKEDPLGLSGFFPIPKPIQPITLTSKRTPVNPYLIYKKQAAELDLITKRITAIIKGLKVRGAVVGDAENIKRVADAGDNELVAIENVEGLAQTGGLDKAIIWWPVDKAITVLRELYISRDQIKQLIYEVTGISDIVRGASNGSETATAQQIKTQWGSLRIQKLQRMIERQCRDLFVLTAEVIASRFTITTLQEITRLEITPEMQEILEGGLKQYMIDVESDSTVRADLSRQKGEMEGFLNGTAAFFSTMAPVIGQAPQMAKPVVDLYQAFARQFNLGKQAEDAIEQMGIIAEQASQGGQPDPEQEKLKAEMEAKQAEMQAKMQLEQDKGKLEVEKLKLEAQRMQADAQLKQAQLAQNGESQQHAARVKEIELQIAQSDLQLKGIDREIAQARLAFDRDKAAAEISIEREQKRAAKVGD